VSFSRLNVPTSLQPWLVIMAAAQSIPCDSHQEHYSTQTKKTKEMEHLELLREKLNRIAVGMTFPDRRVSNQNTCSHFQIFPIGDRPLTPPSSPQPRDLLRKQLRLKAKLKDSWKNHEYNGPTEAILEHHDILCVEQVEIMPISEQLPQNHPQEEFPTISNFSIMKKCPEGFRKRKSIDIDELSFQPNVSSKKSLNEYMNIGVGVSCKVHSQDIVVQTGEQLDLDPLGPEDTVSFSNTIKKSPPSTRRSPIFSS
jgi:hypothetical protein